MSKTRRRPRGRRPTRQAVAASKAPVRRPPGGPGGRSPTRRPTRRRFGWSRPRALAAAAVVIAAAAVIAAVVLGASGRAGLGPRPRFTATDNPRPPPDALAVTPGPWPSGNSDVAPRLQAIGLPALSAEGEVVHTHQHLDIVVNGQHLPVHTQVGIDPLGRFLSPLHTHDATGILHLEATDTAAYTLGQFFDVWGVRFDATCLGVYCADAGHQLRVVANGHPVEGDPRRLTLTAHEEIAVLYGAPSALPAHPPARYRFPAGL